MKAFKFVIIGAMFLLAAECELPDDLGLTPAQRLEGTWKVDDGELKSADNWYYVDIQISSLDSNGILIDNFHTLGEGVSIVAEINGMQLTVPNQTVANDWTIEGSAIISSGYDVLNWTYKVDDGSGIWQNYSATYTKVEGY